MIIIIMCWMVCSANWGRHACPPTILMAHLVHAALTLDDITYWAWAVRHHPPHRPTLHPLSCHTLNRGRGGHCNSLALRASPRWLNKLFQVSVWPSFRFFSWRWSRVPPPCQARLLMVAGGLVFSVLLSRHPSSNSFFYCSSETLSDC